jgi:hypothetical protein
VLILDWRIIKAGIIGDGHVRCEHVHPAAAIVVSDIESSQRRRGVIGGIAAIPALVSKMMPMPSFRRDC